jgi:phage terminase large subunit GpA-like protein
LIPGPHARPALLCVDSGGAVEVETDDTIDGSTTDLVYALSKADPARVVAVKGHGGSKRPDRLVSPRNVDYQPRGMPPTTVLLHILDTERLKDILARLIRAKDPVLWEESSAADADYVQQMTAEERVLLRLGRKKRWSWVNTTRRRNDLWDATVYALAAAKILKVEQRHRALSGQALEDDGGASAPAPAAPAPPPSARGLAETRGDEQKKRFGARMRESGRSWISKGRTR